MGVIPSRMMPMGVFEKPAPPRPYDAEVEYIESTGTQYIDTGVNKFGFADFRLTMDYWPTTATTASSWQFGIGVGSRVVALRTRNASNFLQAGIWQGNTPTAANGIRAGVRHLVDMSNTGWSCDGVWQGAAGTGRPVSNLTVFPFNLFAFTATTSQSDTNLLVTPCACKVGPCAIYVSGVLVRDYIPVRVGTAGYLYDRANPTGGPSGNGLYGSATAAPLIAGPDVDA